MKYMSVITFAICLLTTTVCANDSDTAGSKFSKITKASYSNYLGVTMGAPSGYGLSYRRWTSEIRGFQVSAMGYYSNNTYPLKVSGPYTYIDSGYYNSTNMAIGLQYVRKIAGAGVFRIVASGGGHYSLSKSDYDYYITNTSWFDDSTYVNKPVHRKGEYRSNSIRLGANIGGELYVWRLGLTLAGGIMGYGNFDSHNIDIRPNAEGGVYFRF